RRRRRRFLLAMEPHLDGRSLAAEVERHLDALAAQHADLALLEVVSDHLLVGRVLEQPVHGHVPGARRQQTHARLAAHHVACEPRPRPPAALVAGALVAVLTLLLLLGPARAARELDAEEAL